MNSHLAIKIGSGLVVGALLASACSLGDRTEQVLDPIDSMRDELVATGADEAMVDCIVQLGQREIERSELSVVAADELVLICERSLSDKTKADDEDSDRNEGETALASEPFTIGDDAVFDRLWTECETGTGASCDQLFDESPVGSEYEQFGVSCGERDTVLNCVELDEPALDEQLVPEIYRQWQADQDPIAVPDSPEDSVEPDRTRSTVPAAASASKPNTDVSIAPKFTGPPFENEGFSISPKLDFSDSSRAEKVRAAMAELQSGRSDLSAAVEAVGVGSGWRVQERDYSSPEVAGQTITRSAFELERNNPLANLDPAIAGLISTP